MAINAPEGVSPWFATFGALLLCAQDPGTDLVIEGTRASTSVAPLKVSTSLREVTAADLVGLGPREDDDYAPIGSADGRPPAFDEPYAFDPPKGSFTSHLAGVEVLHTCDSLNDETQGFLELLVTLEVDESGGHVSALYVDYTADGKPMTLRIEWQMIACGTAITEKDACQRPRRLRPGARPLAATPRGASGQQHLADRRGF